MAGISNQGKTLNPLLADPDYVAYTNAPVLLTQTGVLFGITALVIILRCYVRAAMLRSFGKDDWIMLLAFAFAMATFITYAMQTRVGMGKHLAVIKMDEEKNRQFLRLRQVQSILVAIGVSLVKISIAYFLLRLVTKKIYKRCLHGFNIFMVLFTIACLGTLIFQCIPVAAAWDLRLRKPPFGTGTGTCFSPQTFTSIGLMNTGNYHSPHTPVFIIANTHPAVTIATDFLFAIVPIPLIWQLQLNMRSKMALICILALGAFAGVAAIIKSELQKTVLADPDPYIKDSFTLWRFIEFDVGIIAASLPSLRPLFTRFLDVARGTSGSGLKGTGPSKGYGYNSKGLGYNRQNDRSENDIDMRNIVHISKSGQGNHDVRDIGEANASDDSIEPLHPIKPNKIFVTTDVRVSEGR